MTFDGPYRSPRTTLVYTRTPPCDSRDVGTVKIVDDFFADSSCKVGTVRTHDVGDNNDMLIKIVDDFVAVHGPPRVCPS